MTTPFAQSAIAPISTAILFGVVVVLEASVVQSLPAPFALFPLTLAAGVLALHRTDISIGAAWLALSGILAEPWGEGSATVIPFLIAAAVAVPLERKIFTNRSVYALIGMGLSLHAVLVASALVLAALHTLWSDTPLYGRSFVTDRLLETPMLLICLYGGAVAVRGVTRYAKRTFYVNA